MNLSLEKHLEQLKTLYSELTYTTSENSLVDGVFKGLSKYFGTSTTHKKLVIPLKRAFNRAFIFCAHFIMVCEPSVLLKYF